MALTSIVDETGWVQLTATAGQKIACRVEPRDVNYTVYYIVAAAASAPGAEKLSPAAGDNAMIETQRNEWGGLMFHNLDGTEHVYARTRAGQVTVFVTTGI